MSGRIEKNKIICLTVSFLLCVIVLICCIYPQIIDRAVLLEERNSGYWDYLSPEHNNFNCYIKSDNFDSNFLIYRVGTGDLGGMEVTLESDGRLTICGTNSSGDGNTAYLSKGSFQLLDGEYSLNAEGLDEDSEVNLFVTGHAYGKEPAYLAETMRGTTFAADHTKYRNYTVALYVPSGASCDNISFKLSITRINGNTQTTDVIEDSSSEIDYARAVIDKDTFQSKVTYDDLKIYINSLKGSLRSNLGDNVSYYNIDFDDGTGIQFVG